MMPPGSRASLTDRSFGTDDDVGSSLFGLPFLRAAQALAGKFDPVSVVDETIEDGVGVGGVPDHRMMPRLSMGWSLKFVFSLGITGCSARCFLLSA